MYQWFKDDEALIGQEKSVLELNPVQLRDFGCYMCRVSYKDLYGEAEKSNTARLDVIHYPGLNGMSEYRRRFGLVLTSLGNLSTRRSWFTNGMAGRVELDRERGLRAKMQINKQINVKPSRTRTE